MPVETNILLALPYFSGLGATELENIKPMLFDKSIPRGDMIFMEGEPAETLYFLINGIVKLFKTSAQGKEQIISLARPHEVLNDVSIFGNGPNAVSAQAMTPIVIYGIKKDRLEAVLTQYPQVGVRIIRALSERMQQLLTLIEDLSFKHVIGRVAKILLENAADGDVPGHRLTQQEMAAMAGTAREVVARSLKTLEERGLIRLNRHRIVVADADALKEMIELEP
ncbi:MAG: Crp/Fnr family transcriptional regulator [Dehalococcoidia bacterium]|nr:Crp/Fnr family transcriptional regulator [Dehalococcoidia bacterium]